MKPFLFIMLIVIVASCSQQQEAYVDPLLQPYWSQFQIEAERLGVQLPNKNLVMYVTDDIDYPGRVNGLCTKSGKNNVTIEILYKEHLTTEYNTSIEATVFHELAHGYLNRDHNNYFYDSTYLHIRKNGDVVEQSKLIASSLMTIGASRKYWNNGQWREYYLKELFGLLLDYEVYAQQHGYIVKEFQW